MKPPISKTKSQRALGHTRADLIAHLQRDHGVGVRLDDLTYDELKVEHDNVHRVERGLEERRR